MIEPIIVQVTLEKEPAVVFDHFTQRIADWWPLQTHSLGASDNLVPKTVIMEPHVGGRIFEVSDEGVERLWGSITRWEPGSALAFTWHVGRAPESGTIVTVEFRQTDTGNTHITLTHDNWHVLGDEADELRDEYTKGWPALLNDVFVPSVSKCPS